MQFLSVDIWPEASRSGGKSITPFFIHAVIGVLRDKGKIRAQLSLPAKISCVVNAKAVRRRHGIDETGEGGRPHDAARLGRRYIGIDMNDEYLELAIKRFGDLEGEVAVPKGKGGKKGPAKAKAAPAKRKSGQQ